MATPAGLAPGTATALIVDDTPFNRTLLRAVLRQLGVGTIAEAADGLECLALLDSGLRPDIILLDIMMPNLDGYETCRRVRAREDLHDLTIVIQTALTSPLDRASCFEAGATDVVSKPLHPPELIARLRVHLENRLLMRELRGFRTRMTEELRVAQRMQLATLPDTRHLSRAFEPMGLSVAASYRPSEEIGGDLWNAFQLDDHRAAVLMLDFVGHGLIAAINAFRVHQILPMLSEHAYRPDAWLTALNHAMSREFRGEVLATAFYGVANLIDDTLTYASAGAPAPLLASRRGNHPIFAPLPSDGLMLGMLDTARYPLRSAPLAADDGLFLYSDGLTLRPDGSEIDMETVARGFAESWPPDGTPCLEALQAMLPGDSVRNDDVTMLWLGRRATA